MSDRPIRTTDPWPVALAKMLSPESSAALADAIQTTNDHAWADEIFRAAAAAYASKHTATEAAANAAMIALGIHNSDGTLTEVYADGE